DDIPHLDRIWGFSHSYPRSVLTLYPRERGQAHRSVLAPTPSTRLAGETIYSSSGSSAVTFSFHQYVHVSQGLPNWLKPSRSACSRLSPSSSTTLPWLSVIGPEKTSKRSNSPASIWSSRSRIRARSS